MSDQPEIYEQKSDNYRGRYFHPSNRSFYRGRGRGRGNFKSDQAQRTLDELGVQDLRQYIERRQKEQTRSGPPSDPSYNYLRDPSRDADNQPPKPTTPVLRCNSFRGKGTSFIQNPMNIKVKLSTSTGKRNFSVNDRLKLADIEHIPDYNYQDYCGKGGFVGSRNTRRRGRGRSGYDQYIPDQRVRAKSTDRRTNEERGRQVRSRSVEYRKRGEPKYSEYDDRDNMFENYSEYDSEYYSETQTGRAEYDDEYYSEDHRDRADSSRGFRGRGYIRGRGRSRWSRNNQRPNINIEGQSGRDISLEQNLNSDNPTDISNEQPDNFIKQHRGRGRGNRRGRGNQRHTITNTDEQSGNNSQVVDENCESDLSANISKDLHITRNDSGRRRSRGKSNNRGKKKQQIETQVDDNISKEENWDISSESRVCSEDFDPPELDYHAEINQVDNQQACSKEPEEVSGEQEGIDTEVNSSVLVRKRSVRFKLDKDEEKCDIVEKPEEESKDNES